tara:strand:- start:11 stop:451 length:441 start_codon:yes stop_codon:yes gene_type:complete
MYHVKKLTIKEYKECHKIDLNTIKLWNLKQWKKELSKHYVYAFACFSNYEIIGVCVFQKILCNAELIYISIHPKFKRKGLGKKLLKEIFKQCRIFAIEKIFLEVSDKNLDALNFYHSFGFKTTGIRKRYYKDGSNALLQEKKLLNK